MNKLGFAIKLASQGAGNAIECNKGQWTNKVVDIREYLKLFNGLQGTDNIVTFMSFDEGGCFLTQLRAISGRVGDFLSGWIYIPNTIEASGEDVMNTYNYVRNILSQSNLNDYISDIESFFSKEYPSKEVAAQYCASRGQLYGVRFLGHYTLKEIVGEHRYQPYYSDYKVVFLLNKDEEVTITKEAANNFRNLTDKDIVKTSILVPPTNTSLQTLGRGTKIHTADGSDFNQPLLVNVGSKVNLVLSRIGFENIKYEVNVSSERQVIDLANIKITWSKKVSASMFIVRNSKQEKIEKEVRISVNNTDITFQEILVSEDDCRQALVKVSASDYETIEQKQNLLNGSCVIVLNKKVKSFQATVELANGRLAEMTIESKDLSSTNESPLKGYDYDQDYHGNSILKMNSWFVWKQRLLGGLAVFAAGMIIFAFMSFFSWHETHKLKFKFGIPPWEVVQKDSLQETTGEELSPSSDSIVAPPSKDDAINYLDSHDVWSKSEMDKYPDLKGLYDDMNNFNFTNLLNKWKDSLADSKNFMKVCESANKTYTNGWNPKQSLHNPTYNQPNDEQINLTNYINWLDRDQTPKDAHSGGGFHSGTGAGKINSAAGKGGETTGSSKKEQGNKDRNIFNN